jgi:hypothetical protein
MEELALPVAVTLNPEASKPEPLNLKPLSL